MIEAPFYPAQHLPARFRPEWRRRALQQVVASDETPSSQKRDATEEADKDTPVPHQGPFYGS